MSDFTSDMRGMRIRKRRTAHRREYIAYFTLIFLAALPVACLAWVSSAVRHLRLPEKSPVRTAWSDANIITPMIFSA